MTLVSKSGGNLRPFYCVLGELGGKIMTIINLKLNRNIFLEKPYSSQNISITLIPTYTPKRDIIRLSSSFSLFSAIFPHVFTRVKTT